VRRRTSGQSTPGRSVAAHLHAGARRTRPPSQELDRPPHNAYAPIARPPSALPSSSSSPCFFALPATLAQRGRVPRQRACVQCPPAARARLPCASRSSRPAAAPAHLDAELFPDTPDAWLPNELCRSMMAGAPGVPQASVTGKGWCSELARQAATCFPPHKGAVGAPPG
jgi:hypothetical protein